jgi:hypothetical protein
MKERKKEKLWQDLNMQLVITYNLWTIYLFIYLFGLQTDTCNAKWFLFFFYKLVKTIF